MHLIASGLVALGCEMHQTPSALGFPTQLPGSILIPIINTHFITNCYMACSLDLYFSIFYFFCSKAPSGHGG